MQARSIPPAITARLLRRLPAALPPHNQTTKTRSKLTSLNVLLTQEIKDLYSVETQLVKALPKMAKAASDEALTGLAEGFLPVALGDTADI